MDLHLSLAGGSPLRAQLERQLREADPLGPAASRLEAATEP